MGLDGRSIVPGPNRVPVLPPCDASGTQQSCRRAFSRAAVPRVGGGPCGAGVSMRRPLEPRQRPENCPFPRTAHGPFATRPPGRGRAGAWRFLRQTGNVAFSRLCKSQAPCPLQSERPHVHCDPASHCAGRRRSPWFWGLVLSAASRLPKSVCSLCGSRGEGTSPFASHTPSDPPKSQAASARLTSLAVRA